jgi:hypothetical protein
MGTDRKVGRNYMNKSGELQKIVSESERLGVIGSPSSTAELSLDILGTAAMKKLVGELALFQFQQDERQHFALGQITGVALRNVWHEDPTMRSLIRQRGRVDAVSERQDTHLAQMTVSAVFSDAGNSRYEPSILGTVPSTGTNINIVSDEILEELLAPYQDQIFYLGHVYGSKPKLPMWFKHFGSGPQGAGEAYHLGVFGKTGSGKSVLAKMMLCAYAKHSEMAILIIDPQGEFSKDMQGRASGDGLSLPISQIIQAEGRPKPEVHTVKSLVLDRWELFEEILAQSNFFEVLSVGTGDKRQVAARILREQLRKKSVNLTDLWREDSFDKAIELMKGEVLQKQLYPSAEARNRFASQIEDCDKVDLYQNHWKLVGELFNKNRARSFTVDSVLYGLFQETPKRPIIVLDLSREEIEGLLWNDRIQALVIKSVLDGLNRAAERAYKNNESLNALVVIDEAHRLAPRGLSRDGEDDVSDIRKTLIDAARTTRKYGLGWLFISQTLSSIDPQILHQLRIMFFGFGLSMGQEYQSLREIASSTSSSLDLYQRFQDPHSAFDAKSRKYSFMTIGPVSPLSFISTPLFFNAFNTVNAFLEANGLKASDADVNRTSSPEPDRALSTMTAPSSPSPPTLGTQPTWLPGFGDDGIADDGASTT